MLKVKIEISGDRGEGKTSLAEQLITYFESSFIKGLNGATTSINECNRYGQSLVRSGPKEADIQIQVINK